MAILNWKWRGPLIVGHIVDATKDAMDETLAAAVQVAKPMAPFRFGVLRGSIRFESTRRLGNMLVGRFGSFDVHYAIFQELGTSRMAARPYLRPAADREFPKLKGRIRAQFGGA